VKVSSALSRLLALFSILGLLLAPLTLPAAAGSMMGGVGMSMGDKMPDCPESATPDCVKSCPLASLCSLQAVQNIPDVPSVAAAFTVVRVQVGSDEPQSGLMPIPTPRPPRA